MKCSQWNLIYFGFLIVTLFFPYRDLQNNAIQLKKKMILVKINEIKAKSSNNSYTLLND